MVKQGRYEEATASLAYMRREEVDDPEVLKEIADVRAAVEEELNLTEGVTWKEVLIPGNRYRFAVAFTIFLCQQFSGTNSIGYYAPQIFQTVGVSKTNSSLFATGVYGTVKVCATGLFLIIGIDKIGRRWSLLAGALWMMVMMFIEPTLIVMIIGQGATRTDGDEENGEDGWQDVSLNNFHDLK